MNNRFLITSLKLFVAVFVVITIFNYYAKPTMEQTYSPSYTKFINICLNLFGSLINFCGTILSILIYNFIFLECAYLLNSIKIYGTFFSKTC